MLGVKRDGDRALRRARQPENERCVDPRRNALGAMPSDRHQLELSNVRCGARVMSKPVRLLAGDTN
jgi:hypothetical protein